ncbi:alpha/beta hydrolase [Marinobacter panjinensis]|uniref:Alpha/beta hydrolase n=1 Tax=Marinobacter panjinensis TaxID=2576384 RepID=A0A4U6R554_9GAMM|nr:alpha/beta hydrolase [Marinobacter panjinensis]MCR8914182.1 alpha/beta hydrolase [Marinobacter panjinensis]TKV68964.1 alpha/beta hydrolase [Marinobacter panjinensis]
MIPSHLLVLFASILLSACASHQNAPKQAVPVPETDFTTETGITFSPAGWPQALQADLYLPESSQLRPTVLLVHGGGWERRSRADMAWIAERLASRGFAVMNIDYRFAPEHTFPAQLYDLQVAMNWLDHKADTYHLDREAISAFGFSSGAHLVSLMALVAESRHPLNQPHGGMHARPAAVVAGGLPSDLRAFGSGKLIRQFLGGEQESMPAVYQAASPITHITTGAPPFFLFHGAQDMLVPVSQAKEFRARLADHGVETELYLMYLRGHITSFLTAGNAVGKATEFLVRHTVKAPPVSQGTN